MTSSGSSWMQERAQDGAARLGPARNEGARERVVRDEEATGLLLREDVTGQMR